MRLENPDPGLGAVTRARRPAGIFRIGRRIVLALLVTASGSATSGESAMTLHVSGSSACRGADRQSDVLLRYRPLAIVNESAQVQARVACAPPMWEYGSPVATFTRGPVLFRFTNSTTTAASLNCTAFAWFDETPTHQFPGYFTSTHTLPPGVTTEIDFGNNDDYELLVNLTCLLPPRTGIEEVIVVGSTIATPD